MTSHEFLSRAHEFTYQPYPEYAPLTVRISEPACMGFYHGSYIEFDFSGVTVYSKRRVPILPAIYAKEYKRFPIRRFLEWIVKTHDHRIDDSWAIRLQGTTQ